MKQLILIVPAVSKKVNIAAVRAQITSFVGTRLIVESDEEIPGMILKETLPLEDKKAIASLFEDSGAIVFIDMPDEILACTDCGENYISATLTEA